MNTAEFYASIDSTSPYDVYVDKYLEELHIFEMLLQELDIVETTGEEVRNIDLAWRAIARYCWYDYDDTEAQKECRLLIVELARAYYINNVYSKKQIQGERQVTQMSQGSRSVTFSSGFAALDANGLTAEVKASLPAKKLRVL